MLETKCPICGNESLEYSQNADIVYIVVNGRLIPQLDENSIGWMDATYLHCTHCNANNEDDQELSDIKFEYDHHV